MVDRPVCLSVEALSTSLRRDRRSIARALRDVEPDDYQSGRGGKFPVYRLDRALAAIERNDAATGYGQKAVGNGGAAVPELAAIADQCETLWGEVETLKKRLQREHDKARRIELFTKDGNCLVRYGLCLHAGADLVPEPRDRVLCHVIADYLTEGACRAIEGVVWPQAPVEGEGADAVS
jgi:hypothetical protein